MSLILLVSKKVKIEKLLDFGQSIETSGGFRTADNRSILSLLWLYVIFICYLPFYWWYEGKYTPISVFYGLLNLNQLLWCKIIFGSLKDNIHPQTRPLFIYN